MKITPLAPTGDAFKVLYQDDKTLEGFIIGISGSLAMAWGKSKPEEKQQALDIIAEKLVKAYGFRKLHDKEKVYTTHDTAMDFDQAISAIKWNFPH